MSTFKTTDSFALKRVDAMLKCRGCGRLRRVTSLDWLKMFPEPIYLKKALPKLKCRECGEHSPQIAAVPRLDRPGMD